MGIGQTLNFTFFFFGPNDSPPPDFYFIVILFICYFIFLMLFCLKHLFYLQNCFQLDQNRKHLQSNFQSGGTSSSGNFVPETFPLFFWNEMLFQK